MPPGPPRASAPPQTQGGAATAGTAPFQDGGAYATAAAAAGEGLGYIPSGEHPAAVVSGQPGDGGGHVNGALAAPVAAQEQAAANAAAVVAAALRRPSYFARPVVNVPPPPAAAAFTAAVATEEEEVPPPGTEDVYHQQQQQQQGLVQNGQAGDQGGKSLPPALLARLKKRGILKAAEAGAGTPTAAAGGDAMGGFGAAGAADTSSYGHHADPAPAVIPHSHAPSVPAVTPVVTPAAPSAAAAAAGGALPPGWQETIDPTYNHPYFYNVTTGERSWTRPGAAAPAPAAAAAPPASTTAGATAVSASPKVISAAPVASGAAAAAALPLGWVEAVDPASGHK